MSNWLWTLLLSGFLFAGNASAAEIRWIDLPLSSGGQVKALLGLPEGAGQHPAVIYSHGLFVRRVGYETAAAHGYDIKDYVEALAKAGYVALAPVRDVARLPDPDNYRGRIMDMTKEEFQGGIRQGVAAIEAGAAFLQSNTPSNGKLGIMGFSEGGLVTLWAAVRGLDAQAVVLMSPATMREAGRYSMKPAAQSEKLKGVKGAVMITMGLRDGQSILKAVPKRLVPALEKAGKTPLVKADYPGDHSWFYKVRPEHWADVVKFLGEHLN